MAGLLVAAACSSGDGDTSPTTAAPPATVTSTTVTTAPPVTTTDAPPSTAITTDATVAGTTAPTPTTSPDEEAVRQAVIDAAVESWRVFNEAKLDPTNDEKVAAIGDVRSGALVEFSIEFIGNYRFNMQRARTNPDFPAAIEIYDDTVEIDIAAGTATVEYCRLDSNLVIQLADDGSEQVVDDGIAALHETAELEFLDGGWVEVGGVLIEAFDGQETCERAAE